MSYADGTLPFTAWMKGVEARIKDMKTIPRTKDLLLLEKDEMKVRSQPTYRSLMLHDLNNNVCMYLCTYVCTLGFF